MIELPIASIRAFYVKLAYFRRIQSLKILTIELCRAPLCLSFRVVRSGILRGETRLEAHNTRYTLLMASYHPQRRVPAQTYNQGGQRDQLDAHREQTALDVESPVLILDRDETKSAHILHDAVVLPGHDGFGEFTYTLSAKSLSSPSMLSYPSQSSPKEHRHHHHHYPETAAAVISFDSNQDMGEIDADGKESCTSSSSSVLDEALDAVPNPFRTIGGTSISTRKRIEEWQYTLHRELMREDDIRVLREERRLSHSSSRNSSKSAERGMMEEEGLEYVIWRYTKKFMRTVMGIDDDVLEIMFGEHDPAMLVSSLRDPGIIHPWKQRLRQTPIEAAETFAARQPEEDVSSFTSVSPDPLTTAHFHPTLQPSSSHNEDSSAKSGDKIQSTWGQSLFDLPSVLDFVRSFILDKARRQRSRGSSKLRPSRTVVQAAHFVRNTQRIIRSCASQSSAYYSRQLDEEYAAGVFGVSTTSGGRQLGTSGHFWDAGRSCDGTASGYYFGGSVWGEV